MGINLQDGTRIDVEQGDECGHVLRMIVIDDRSNAVSCLLTIPEAIELRDKLERTMGYVHTTFTRTQHSR